jgi:hypothetical protein
MVHILFSLCIIFLFCCSDNQAKLIIGLRENIHHDDFEYSVTGYTLTHQIGKGQDSIVSAGTYYIVTFKVENRAIRVSHLWNNSIAYIIDDEKNNNSFCYCFYGNNI